MKLSAKIGAFEIQGDEVRLVIVKTGGKLPRVLEVHGARANYESDDDRLVALMEAVQAILERLKSRPSVYVLCASSSWSIVRLLKIPFRSRRRVAAAVPFELEPYLAFPVEELSIDFSPVREVDKETEVLVVGLRREFLEEQVAILEEAGVAIEGVNLDAAGLTSLWHGLAGKRSGVHAALHLRDEGAVFTVTRGKSLAYMRHMSMPLSRIHDNPRGAAREVLNVMRAFMAAGGTSEELASLTVTGTEFFEEERNLFEGELGLPVEYCRLMPALPGAGKALQSVEGGVDTSEPDRWAACAGVANTAAGGPFSFNFPPLRKTASPIRRGMVAHAVFTVVLALLALGGYGAYSYVDYRANIADLEVLGARIWRELNATFPNSERTAQRPSGDVGGARSYEYMNAEIDTEIEGRGQSGQGISLDTYSRPTLLDILVELAEKVPDEKASLTNVKMTVGKTAKITIAGEVIDPVAFIDVLVDLQRSKVFVVDIDGQKRSSSGGKERFELVATN